MVVKPVTLKQMSKLRLGRESLEKWINEKDFESLIKGCFVRVLLAEKNKKRIYRIATITGVDTTDQVYKVGDSWTGKLLILNWGTAQRSFKMDFISNGEFSDSEYEEWMEQMQKCDLALITNKDVEKKIKEIKAFVQQKRMQLQNPQPTPEEPPAPDAAPSESLKRPAPEAEPEAEEPAQPEPKKRKVQEAEQDDDAMDVVQEPEPALEPEPPVKEVDMEAMLEILKRLYDETKQVITDRAEYLSELGARNGQQEVQLDELNEKSTTLLADIVQKRKEANEPAINYKEEAEKECASRLAECEKRFEQEMEGLKKDTRRRDKLLCDLEDDIADVQKQIQRAKAVAEEERASLQQHVGRKEKQAQEVIDQFNAKTQKLAQSQEANHEQQTVISLQDHTIQELESQLKNEHTQLVAVHQKRRKQAIVLKSKLQELQSMKDNVATMQEKVQILLNPALKKEKDENGDEVKGDDGEEVKGEEEEEEGGKDEDGEEVKGEDEEEGVVKGEEEEDPAAELDEEGPDANGGTPPMDMED